MPRSTVPSRTARPSMLQGGSARPAECAASQPAWPALLMLPLAACTGTPGPGPGSATATSRPPPRRRPHRRLHLRHRLAAARAGPGPGLRHRVLPDHPPGPGGTRRRGPDHRRAHAAAGHRMDSRRRRPRLHVQAPREGDVPGRDRLRRRGSLQQLQPLVQLLADRCGNRPPGTTFKGVFKAHADQASLSIYKGCTAVAPDNVTIDLTQPFTGFLQALTLPAFAISSPQALAAQNADELNQSRDGQPVSAYGLHPVGTGPYVFSSWDPGSITLASNKDYWGDKGQIGTINFVTYDHTADPDAGPARRQNRRLRRRHRRQLRPARQDAASRSSSAIPSPSCTWA